MIGFPCAICVEAVQGSCKDLLLILEEALSSGFFGGFQSDEEERREKDDDDFVDDDESAFFTNSSRFRWCRIVVIEVVRLLLFEKVDFDELHRL